MDVLDDEMFGDMDASLDDPELDSSPQVEQSTETSNFGLWKRGRSRQSSIVGRDDAPIRPSSRGQNTPGLSSTFNLGLFKRRAREPSILGARDRSRADRAASESEAEGGVLAPEIESTPLTRTRTRSQFVSQSSAAAASRKRKSESGQQGQPKRRSRGPDETIHDSIETPVSPLSEPVEQAAPSTPVMNDAVMAPPESSGSEAASPSMWPSLKSLTQVHRNRRQALPSRKTPGLDDDSDISSPPSLTHSPNYHAPQAASKGRARAPPQRKPSIVTTAALTALLPQRRKKKTTRSADPFLFDSDGESTTAEQEDEDEDDLAVHTRRTRARQPTRMLQASKTTAAQSSRSKATRNSRRKYGSRNFSDKENQGEEGDSIEVEPLPDDTFDSTNADDQPEWERSEELKKAARKFKEVDKWELSFEEVTFSSSPPNAR
jgi:hypothetical protein